MSSLENCLISTYLLWFSTRVQVEKNWGDTPSATLKLNVKTLKFINISRIQIFSLNITFWIFIENFQTQFKSAWNILLNRSNFYSITMSHWGAKIIEFCNFYSVTILVYIHQTWLPKLKFKKRLKKNVHHIFLIIWSDQLRKTSGKASLCFSFLKKVAI